jgi:hypothetical protein
MFSYKKCIFKTKEIGFFVIKVLVVVVVGGEVNIHLLWGTKTVHLP